MVKGFIAAHHAPMPAAKTDTVQELTYIVGEAAAAEIVLRWGGRSVSFSAKRHEFLTLIGPDATRALIHHYQGCFVYVPKGFRRSIWARNKALYARFDKLTQTLSARSAVARLAEEFDLSDRRVWAILKKASPPQETGYQP